MRDPALTNARTVWAGILCSVCLFYVALRMSTHSSAPADASSFFVFAALAVSGALASFFLPTYLHRRGARRTSLETREAETAITANSTSTTRRVFVNPDKARSFARRLYQSWLILSLALSESVALVGLLLGFRGFPEERVLPFFVASLTLIAVRFPRAHAPERMLETSAGARFPQTRFP
jgi:hypothetical protein